MTGGESSKATDDWPIGLRWRRARLERELDKQLEVGDQLLDQCSSGDASRSADELAELRDRVGSWHQRNFELLEQAFTHPRMAWDYQHPFVARPIRLIDDAEDVLEVLRRDVSEHIARLKSIRDRVDLYDQAVSAPSMSADLLTIVVTAGALLVCAVLVVVIAVIAILYADSHITPATGRLSKWYTLRAVAGGAAVLGTVMVGSTIWYGFVRHREDHVRITLGPPLRFGAATAATAALLFQFGIS
jgi:hypothetical protein